MDSFGGDVVTARDELVEDLATKVPKADWDMADEIGDLSGVANALIAAGWRKMPSRAKLLGVIANAEVYRDGATGDWQVPLAMEAERIADLVLALMDGDNE